MKAILAIVLSTLGPQALAVAPEGCPFIRLVMGPTVVVQRAAPVPPLTEAPTRIRQERQTRYQGRTLEFRRQDLSPERETLPFDRVTVEEWAASRPRREMPDVSEEKTAVRTDSTTASPDVSFSPAWLKSEDGNRPTLVTYGELGSGGEARILSGRLYPTPDSPGVQVVFKESKVQNDDGGLRVFEPAMILNPRRIRDSGHPGSRYVSVPVGYWGTSAMELLHEGGTLAQSLGAVREKGFEGMLKVFWEVSQALEATHRTGVVHRDLDPSNIFLTHHGEVRIGDWGSSGEIGQRQTPGGKGGFMPTDQWVGNPNRPSYDIHAAGLTFQSVLHGMTPRTAALQAGEKSSPLTESGTFGPYAFQSFRFSGYSGAEGKPAFQDRNVEMLSTIALLAREQAFADGGQLRHAVQMARQHRNEVDRFYEIYAAEKIGALPPSAIARLIRQDPAGIGRRFNEGTLQLDAGLVARIRRELSQAVE